MWEYSYYPTGDELYHHGILGMHWGERNGPPYPLDGSAHSSSEKKVGWQKSLDNDGRVAAAKKNKKVAKKNAKNAKAIRKERQKMAMKQHTEREKEIEERYKRGETLSKKDLKREEANDKRLDKEWNSAKKQQKKADKAYKQAKQEYKEAKKEAKEQERLNKKTEKDLSKFNEEYAKTWYKPYNNASERFNRELISINQKYEGKDLRDSSKGIGKKYMQELDSSWRNIYTEELNTYYKVPETIGKEWVNDAVFMNSIIDSFNNE